MKAFTQEMIRWGLLLFAALWVVMDWVTVGSNVGGDDFPWAPDWTRTLLLVLATAFCGLAASEARRGDGSEVNRMITSASAMLMAACCAYTVWRTYIMSALHQDTLYLTGGLILQIAVFYLTLRLKRYKVAMNATR